LQGFHGKDCVMAKNPQNFIVDHFHVTYRTTVKGSLKSCDLN